MSTNFNVTTRWMLKSDNERVLDIEFESFEPPWDEEILEVWKKEKAVAAIVAERCGQVAGYAVYAVHRHRIEIIRLGVAPEHRRYGIATQMVHYLFDRLETRRDGRNEIVVHIPERDLAAQLFLKRLGFRMTDTFPDTYELPAADGEEPQKQAAYQMTYKLLRPIDEND